jgi:LacI family transcriptional regulator
MGSRAVTMADIAAHAGVSKTTVSRVLNGKGEQDPQTAERVRSVMAELGYVPSARARALALRRAGYLGFVIPEGTWWPWTLLVLQGTVGALASTDFMVVLSTVSEAAASHEEFSRRILRSQALDGIVAVLPPEPLDYLDLVHSSGIPVVLIDEREYGSDFPTVRADNIAGARDAVRHLFDRGRRRIGVIHTRLVDPVYGQRLRGYQEALGARGCASDHVVEASGVFSADGEAATEALLSRVPDLDALVCVTDQLAVGAMRAIRRRGLSIPGDVAVVGFDDSGLAEDADPPMTTIHLPLAEMGAAAAHQMLRIMEGQSPEKEVVLSPWLVARETT